MFVDSGLGLNLGVSASDPVVIRQVLATSENLAIRFDPPLLDLNPILPFVDESERLVTVHNETDSEIEVTGPFRFSVHVLKVASRRRPMLTPVRHHSSSASTSIGSIWKKRKFFGRFRFSNPTGWDTRR